jgi:hypothetical protein
MQQNRLADSYTIMFSIYIPGHVDDKLCATDIEVDYKLSTFFKLLLVTKIVTA